MKQREVIIVMDFFYFIEFYQLGLTDRCFFLLFPLDWEQEVDL